MNMRWISLFLFVVAGAVGGEEAAKPNVLTDDEKKAGYLLLFDGTSTAQWRSMASKEFPKKGWVVEDGCLKHQAKGGGGDIITVEEYENYEFSFEWKIAPGANSGVKYRVVAGGGAAFGPEFQLIDDSKHADAKNGTHTTGSLYDMIPPANKTAKPAGEFNTSRLLVQGDHVEHWVNGTKVVEYDFNSPQWKELYAKSKYAKNPKFAATPKAHIALQDHGDEIAFRNLKIRALPAK